MATPARPVRAAVRTALLVPALAAALLAGAGASVAAHAAAPPAVRSQLDPTALECLGGAEALGRLASGDTAKSIPRADPAKQIAAIATWLEKERSLRFTVRPEPTFVTTQQIDARMKASITKQYPAEEARQDRDLLVALGAVPPGTDLVKMQADLLGGQVAGYYDDDTGELVVLSPKPGTPLKAMEQITLSHELEHALADQALGLPKLDRLPPAEADARSAITSLIEGDATVTMQRFAVQEVSLADQMALLGDPLLGKQSADLEKFPQYLQKSLVFPYEEGLNFVCSLVAKGGWEAVDRAYEKPPTSTAQILFPSRYAAGEQPKDPRHGATLPAPWKRTRTIAVGAADLLFLFEAPGDRSAAALPDARGRVAAWAGGEAAQWRNATATATGIALVQRKGSTGLCNSVSRWYRAAFPDAKKATTRAGETFALDGARQDAVLRCSGSEVRLGIGPDIATARVLAR